MLGFSLGLNASMDLRPTGPHVPSPVKCTTHQPPPPSASLNPRTNPSFPGAPPEDPTRGGGAEIFFSSHPHLFVSLNLESHLPCFRSPRARSGSVFGAQDMAEDAPVEVAAPAPAPTPVLGEPMDLMTALQLVMKKSSAHDGLVKGLREAAKAIEKHAAQICVLAEDCDQPDYVKLVKALCAEHNVHLVTVPSAKTLGEWAGLCKIDTEGKARKVVGCSCVVVKDYGEETEGLNIVREYVSSH
ncbi:hypothetical protein BRADI_1g06520v3 [Brachypodium distachyon]|uniref:40S ribosomal protein S12 n=2 Tax=Brachypodium distachyon TaxID=15368 RepID=A0A0Q3KP17_BRADI|nr:hypothetical protein BRADI_1g06520v3 [Brachypodium distachyon]